MRYFKIPLCPKFEQCEKTKMPLGAKTTQTDSDTDTSGFVQNLINDSCKQIEKTQGQIVGTKMGSIAGNDQNTLLYDFMQELKDRNGNVCSWSTLVSCKVIHSKLKKY